MKIIIKEWSHLADAYQYCDQMTSQGFEILELSPTHLGCRVVLRVPDQLESKEGFEVSQTILQAYLGLNKGHTKDFITLIEFESLIEAFELSARAESCGFLVHEIRALRSFSSSHHIIVSHDLKVDAIQKLPLDQKKHYTFSTQNKRFCDFLGFSNITIKG